MCALPSSHLLEHILSCTSRHNVRKAEKGLLENASGNYMRGYCESTYGDHQLLLTKVLQCC